MSVTGVAFTNTPMDAQSTVCPWTLWSAVEVGAEEEVLAVVGSAWCVATAVLASCAAASVADDGSAAEDGLLPDIMVKLVPLVLSRSVSNLARPDWDSTYLLDAVSLLLQPGLMLLSCILATTAATMSDTRTVMKMDVRRRMQSARRALRRALTSSGSSSSWYRGGARSAPYAGGCRGLEGMLSARVESSDARNEEPLSLLSVPQVLARGVGYRIGGPWTSIVASADTLTILATSKQ
jgi:hypothetical protein